MDNESEQPVIEFNFTNTIDFRKLAREFIKIAYETAYYMLGEKYLNDNVGQDLRKSLFDENQELIEKYTERGMEVIGNPKRTEIFNEINNHSDKNLIHLIQMSEIGNKLYVAINLFNVYNNCIYISENSKSYNLDKQIYLILFYYDNNEKTFDIMNELDLTKKYIEKSLKKT